MNILQGVLHSVEEGGARSITRLVPLIMALVVILVAYDKWVYSGLNDAQSMDNAQLARQIERGAGFTTKFIRPAALAQMNGMLVQGTADGKPTSLFPDAQFPQGADRILPDTYNSPGYPYLLSSWFKVMVPSFTQTPREISLAHLYGPDRRIPWLNQIFLFLNGVLVFILGLRLFDERVAWVSMLGFFATNLIWQYSLTALSTSFLMFLCTVLLIAAVEIFSWAESRAEGRQDPAPAWQGWLWALLLGGILGVICLTRLNLLFLVVPIGVYLFCVPQGAKLFIPLVVLIVLGMTGPWFWNMYKISGSPIGSNSPLLHYATPGHEGNQIYCMLAAPDYNQLFKDVAGKQFVGFGWALTHGWELLGASPLVLLFFASTLHGFKRVKAQSLRWLILGLGGFIIFATNCGNPHPGAMDAWNSLVLLLPGMMVVGAAFFFILVDRLELQLWVLNNAIAVALVVLTACPMIGALVDGKGNKTYPPYSPAALRAMGDFGHKEDWIATDLPWASAWYGDRASIWLPDTLADFDDIYDNYNNSDLLLITPVFLGSPVMTFTTGEYKDWMPFVAGGALPKNFPLNTRAPTGAGFIEYLIWGRGNGKN